MQEDAVAKSRVFWFSDLVRDLIVRLRHDLPIYGVIAAYSAFGLALIAVTGQWQQAIYLPYLDKWLVMFVQLMLPVALWWDALMVMVRFERHRRLAFARTFSAKRFAHTFAGIALLLSLFVFQGTFTTIKNMLPVLAKGFTWDRHLADFDQWLHFGQAPWQWLHVTTSPAWLRLIVDWNYFAIWSVWVFGLLFYWVTVPRRRADRLRYIIMFIFTWVVLGNLLAGLFVSAGPAFYGQVTGDVGRFGPLMDFLAAGPAPAKAVDFQTMLWRYYTQGLGGFGTGISAFPSVHVGMTAMNALFLAERSRLLGILGFIYMIVIMISSVYLGWHYAVDGYVAVLVVAVAQVVLRHFMIKRTTGAVQLNLNAIMVGSRRQPGNQPSSQVIAQM